MLESGVVLSDRYRLEERVATGGMGEVWRAIDVLLNRRVAVKVLLPALLADPDFIARFRAEARMMAALHTPGVVQVYDSGEATLDGGGRANYLVMEYVDGEPLSQRLKAVGRLGVTETMSIVAQAAQALHAAHLAGIVHRDVKPSNLLVQSDGAVVLVDFGVARSTAVTSITGTNAVPGTALYMAPEQALGKRVSGASDIYALGAVAYHCLAGRTPFIGDNPLEVAIKHTQDEPPPLPDDVPQPVAALVSRAMAKDPADRFPDAEALAEAARDAPTAADAAALAPTYSGYSGVGAARGGPGPVTGQGPRTLTDLPAVPSAVPVWLPRHRAASVVLVAVVLVFAAAGLAAALNQPGGADAPADGPAIATLPPEPSVTPSETAGEDRDESERRHRSTGHPVAPKPEPSSTTPPVPATPSQAPSVDPTPSTPADGGPTPSAEPNPPSAGGDEGRPGAGD